MTATKTAAKIHAYAVILLDRVPSDPMVFIDDDQADRNSIPCSDRDGNTYIGRLVWTSTTYTDACRYVAQMYGRGQLHDATPCGQHQLVISGLVRLPHGDSPLKFPH